MKLCIALLLLVVVTSGQDQFSDTPLDNPFTTFNAPPIAERKISDEVIATIGNGDFLHPAFSPDGKTLAYSQVLLQGDFENTEVFLYNLRSRKNSVLLNSKTAKKYATYKAFVAGIDWKSPRRLEIRVGDGDVDSTSLLFDPYTRKLLRERHQVWDEPETQPLSPLYQKARNQAVSVFPAFSRDVLDNALRNTALVIPDKGIVLQKNYAGHDSNIWFVDFQNNSIKSLISLSAESSGAFDGGVSFNSSIILLLSQKQQGYLFLYRGGKIKGLGQFNSTTFRQIEVKYRSSSKVIFLVRMHASYERGDNPLFIFDGEQLFRVKEYPELHDAAVDPSGQRIAYCYWEGDKRHVVVKELN